MIDLYRNIKEQRIKHGMSQEELAHKIGYADKTMISRIENGKIDLPQSKIEEFANIFNVTPGNLMGWDVPEEKPLKVSVAGEESAYLTRIGTYAEHMYPDNANIKDIRNQIAQIETEPTEATKALLLYQKYQQAPDFVQAAIRKLLGDPESES